MVRKFLIALPVALLAACQTSSYVKSAYVNENTPFYLLPPASHIALTKDITVPSDQLRVLIQNGKILSNSEVQHYYPFCTLELNDLSNQPRTVGTDDFIVTKAVHEEVSGGIIGSNGSPYYARMSLHVVADMGGGPPGGPQLQSYNTRMELHSDKQPDVRRLVCSQWGYQGIDRHVTLEEIRKTLAPLFTVRESNP